MSLSPKEIAAVKRIISRAEWLLKQAKKVTGSNPTARRKGQRIRRTSAASETLHKEVKAAHAKGRPVAKIAAVYKVSPTYVYKILKG